MDTIAHAPAPPASASAPAAVSTAEPAAPTAVKSTVTSAVTLAGAGHCFQKQQPSSSASRTRAAGDMAVSAAPGVSSAAHACGSPPCANHWLPSDVIDAIADAIVASIAAAGASGVAVGACVTAERDASMQRLGIAPALSDDAQHRLRELTHVCRAWRAALLRRAWRSLELTGAASPAAIHAFAAPSVRRLVVPWGAMAAPMAWAPAHPPTDDGDGGAYDASVIDDDADDLDGASLGRSADSHSRLRLGLPDKPTGIAHSADSASRLRGVFGDCPWPAVEHLDMSFMPLICYQGFAAHIQRTMPRLRTLRIAGFVPATALPDVLRVALMPLASVEIAASVWANADGAHRRRSASSSSSAASSSWRSSVSTTVAPADPSEHGLADPLPGLIPAGGLIASTAVRPLTLLSVTSDALRSPAVFALARAQMPTLRELHVLECDYKIMDMLRTGRLEERHQLAVEWSAAAPMVLHSQEQHQQHAAPPAGQGRRGHGACWPALTRLRIERYFMAPRENTGLRIHADCMPALEELAIDHMEPSDTHHPVAALGDAAQVPRLSGRFPSLARIRAPAFDIHTLPERAPALRCLCITANGGPFTRAAVPSSPDIATLLNAHPALKSVTIAGKPASLPTP